MISKIAIKSIRTILNDGIEFINANGSKVKFDEEGFMVFSNFVYISLVRLMKDELEPFIKQGGKDVLKELNIFNSDAKPIIPKGYNWTIEKHKKGGDIDLSKIELYLDEKQKNGYIKGSKLRIKLKNKKVLNANVLDYLLAHPELIPEEWKEKVVFFWGTIYRNSDGKLYVRYLNWYGLYWYWDCGWLDYDFDSGSPAALAS